MFFFWRILLAHLLADFTFQTNRIAKWKREDISGVLFHVLIFLFFAAAINYEYLNDPKLSLILLLLGAFHILEDQWRIISIGKYQSPDNLTFFLWDQFLHIVLIFAFSPSQLSTRLILPPSEKWVIILCLFIFATHFATILTYFIKKMRFRDATIIQQEKIHGIVERILIVSCFIIPGGYFWVAMPILVVLIIVERTSLNKNGIGAGLDFSKINLLSSNIIAVICSIFAWFVYKN